MTTYRSVKVYCALCGTPQIIQELMSYTSFAGGTTLDYQDYSHPIWTAVQACTVCGYASSKISTRPKFPEVLKSKEYQAILKHRWISDSCKSYLCKALFLLSENDVVQTAWATISAAHSCDTCRYWQGSHDYRLKAVELIEIAHGKQHQLIRRKGEDFLLKSDLLRRCGEFIRARTAINDGLNTDPRRFIQELLKYEQQLVDAGDIDSHMVSDAGFDERTFHKEEESLGKEP